MATRQTGIYERPLSTGKEWYIRYRFPQTRTGRLFRERVGPGQEGKEQAKILLGQRLQDIRQGRDPSLRIIKPRLFEDVALEFLATYVGAPVDVVREEGTIRLRRKPGNPVALKKDPDTFIHNVAILLRAFEGRTLQAIDSRAVEDFIRDRLAKGKTRGTTNRQRNSLSRIFTWAIDRGYFGGENPVRRVKRFAEQGRERFLTADQAALLLAKVDSRFWLLLLAALHTGARRGELLKLVWSDLDLEKRLVTFRDTKNGENRTLPLSATLTAELKRLPRPIQGGAVFRMTEGSALKPGSFRKAFQAAVEAADLGAFRFHDLRHSAASFWAQAGVPLNTIRAMLGHKTQAMVLKYAHLAPEHLRDATAVMDSLAAAAAEKATRERNGEA